MEEGFVMNLKCISCDCKSEALPVLRKWCEREHRQKQIVSFALAEKVK